MPARSSLESFNRHPQASAGFTFIETLVVLVLLGIFSAYYAPKAFKPSQFTLRAQVRNLAGHVQYAQWLAVTTGSVVSVCASSGAYLVQIGTGACPTTMPTQTSTSQPVLVALQNASMGSTGNLVTFNTLGTPASATDTSIGMSAPGSSAPITFTIAAMTGLVSM
jgi:prepilin-type N-terminal cleavage/methylation domain-containing protein